MRVMFAGKWLGLWVAVLMGLSFGLSSPAVAQTVPTTTVQGTVYLANGQAGSGTVLISWPAFTTAANQQVAAGSTTVTVGSDGFLTVNLAANLGSNPAGLYYTAVFHLSDGTVNTQYWVVPAAASATLGSVQAQLMPAAQAVQTVSKAYVDQAITSLEDSLLTANGGTLTGPLTLCCDPTAPLQAADKHYVDQAFAQAVPLAGGAMTGSLSSPSVNGAFSPAAGSSQTTLQATQTAAVAGSGAMVVPGNYAGSDSFTNVQGIRVEDLRASGAQQHERSFKEFGAVCDGVTNDTAALQAALNYAQARAGVGSAVSLVLPAGVCKTHALVWHGESIGGQGRQASFLMGYPGEDVLATVVDSPTIASNTHLHDFTLEVDQSSDVSCAPAQGRATAGACGVSRPVASGSVLSAGGNGLTGVAGTGAGWWIGNCAIAMPATTGGGGNGLKSAVLENLGITAVGADPLGAYNQADSTHSCGLYLAQWPQGSEFRDVAITGVGTGIAVPAVAAAAALGVSSDTNKWQNISIAAVHGFVAQAGSNGVLDNVQVSAWNSAAAGEAPTGLVLDLAAGQQGWTVRNQVVNPEWFAVLPRLTITASGGAVTAVAVGPEHGLGFEPYGVSVPLSFSGSCTAAATALVNSDGSLGSVTVTSGGVGCSGTTTAAVNVSGTAMLARAVNLIAGTQMSFLGGNLLKGVGGYTVWNAGSSRTSGTQMGGGGTLPASATTYPALVIGSSVETGATAAGDTGSANRFDGLSLPAGGLLDGGLGNALVQTAANGVATDNLAPTRLAGNTVSADFALLGGGTTAQDFTSLSDLMFSAEDLWSSAGEPVAAGSLFGKDVNAPVTGSYVKAVGGAWATSGVFTVRGVANFLTLGNSFPAGSGTWVVAAKADAAATQELKLLGSVGAGPSSSCVFADQTVSLTTSWQVFRIPYNTVTGVTGCDSASAGNPVTAEGLAPSVATNVSTAFVAFVPAFQQLLIANQPTVANQAANKASIDTSRWWFSNNGAYFSITGLGLTFNGGLGIDGQSAMYWGDQVEAGGTLLLEAVGVQLAPGSSGIVAGLYSNPDLVAANCQAGFLVTAAPGTGALSVAAYVDGAVSGASFALDPAQQYVFRTRVHCLEVERITQPYRVVGDAGMVVFGGGGVVAAGWAEMELVEIVDGVTGTPVRMFDGAVGYLPAAFTVVAASSQNLIGTMRALYMKGLGTGWVSTVAPGAGIASAATAGVGAVADGAVCEMMRTGFLRFNTGYAPVLGAVVAAQYRSSGRAVGRAVNAASQAALAAAGSPAEAVWIGSVTEPKGRSSRDCRNAAQALVTAASSVSAAWSGTYKTTNVALNAGSGASTPVDVWPGDALLLMSATLGLDVQVVVREVVLKYAASSPDVVGYQIAFSNDWANDLSVKTSRTVPEDVWLPAAVSPTYLANLTGLTVTGISTSAVTVNAGVTAPTGGGFEVRRRDFAFGAGTDPDLVVRASVATFDIPRATEADRFYIRMYDGSTPPKYSEFSVGLFLNLPLSTTL